MFALVNSSERTRKARVIESVAQKVEDTLKLNWKHDLGTEYRIMIKTGGETTKYANGISYEDEGHALEKALEIKAKNKGSKVVLICTKKFSVMV